jgi:hypothetical protein
MKMLNNREENKLAVIDTGSLGESSENSKIKEEKGDAKATTTGADEITATKSTTGTIKF